MEKTQHPLALDRQHRRARPSALKRWTGAATATAVAVGLALTGSAPAYADDGEHRSHAQGQLINLDALGIDAATGGSAEQHFLDYPGEPSVGTVDAQLLDQLINLNAGGISLPILPDGLQAGAVSSFAHTPEPDMASASAGAVASNGAIDVSGVEPYGYATVELNDALGQLGLDTDGVVDALALELGALASRAEASGGDLDSEYVVAGARLTMDSPLVGNVFTLLNDSVADLDGTVNGLIGDSGPIQQSLDGISIDPVDVNLAGLSALSVDLGSPELNASVGLSDVVDGVLGEPLISESGLVTIDLSTGQLFIDLAQLHGGDLNNLDANTTLLSSSEIEQVTQEVTTLLGLAADQVTDAVNTAIETTEVTLTLTPDVSAAGGLISGDIGITIDTTIAELLAGGDAIGEGAVDITGGLEIDLGLVQVPVPLGDLLDGLLGPILNELLPAISGPFVNELEGLGSSVGTTIDEALSPVLAGLEPVLQALNQVVSLTVNAQSQPGDLGESSFTVRALDVTVLPSLNAVSLQMAASSVYAEDPAVLNPAITVDPSTVEQDASTEVTGRGFAAEESVTVSIPGAAEGDGPITVETTTDADGGFTVDLPISADYPLGDVTVTAVGAESDTPATADLTVVATGDGGDDGDFDTAITVDPSTVEQGASTEVTGSGFAAEETVTVSIPGATEGDDPITVETTTNADGEFTVDLPIPEDYPTGDVEVTAVGAESETPATADLSVTADGGPDADADGAADPGANVDASASASASADADADADPAAQAAAQVAADADAETTASADTSAAADADADPAAQAAAESASDEDASTTASTDADSASEAAAQAAATADADSEAAADATAAGDPDAAAAAQAAANADASTDAAAAVAGDADASADGAGDGNLDPSVAVQPESVQPGDEVDITGGGFIPGSTVTVTVTDAEGNIIGTIEAVDVDENGEFVTAWTVPDDTTPGELTVTATDDSDGDITGSAVLSVADGVATAGESPESNDDGGLLARTGAASIWLLGGLSILLLLAGSTALIMRKRMSSTE